MGKFKSYIINENLDIKLSKQKALGLTYIGWGVYINKNIQKFRWDKQTLEFYPIYIDNIDIFHRILSNNKTLFINILRIINKVHRIDLFDKNQTLIFNEVDKKYFGDEYTKARFNIITKEINVYKYTPTKYIDIVHEIGHWIDNIFSEEYKMTDNNTEFLLYMFMDKLKKTGYYKKIQILHNKTGDSVYSYLMEPREMFARFYVQFITKYSNSKILKRQFLQDLIYTETFSNYYIKEDFNMLKYDFKTILKVVGWNNESK
jgi:hypothetical protein